MSSKTWKDHLLKSGLPFEYEVKECFVKHSCTVWDEYFYLKEDENNLEKEFSYDIEANYWQQKYSFNFMIECKYRVEPTKWFFLPDPYSYQQDITQNSFLHTIDYFKTNKFLFGHEPYDKVQKPLGPFCLKGVEIYQNQFLETNIFKAINQLSFAFVQRVIQSLEAQIEDGTFSETTFFNIPIIITNAELYLINKKLKTSDIEKSQKIEEISKRHNFLLFHNKIGESLKKYNKIILNDFFSSIGQERFKQKNKSFALELDHFIDVVAGNYCPEVILIMHHDSNHKNYKKLFDYINFMIKPSKKLDEKQSKITEAWKKLNLDFKEKFTKK